MSVITVDKLCKSYGKHSVLNNIQLNVDAGKLVGFLGPNGAGKTTTIRILLGLLNASSGKAEVLGKCSKQFGKQIRQNVGYLPGDVHFYPSMTGRATAKFLAAARKRSVNDEIDRLADVFGLELDKKVRRYSTGMRQKLGLIQAMMHKPDLLILDEPTSALDPLVRKSVFSELRKTVNEGRTVLFSSHSLDEVEELCDEVIILRDGNIVEHQKIDVLREKALKRIEVVFAPGTAVPQTLPEKLSLIEKTETTLHATWAGEIDSLLSWLRDYPLADLVVERPDLNDLFITYYRTGENSTSLKENEDV